MKRILLSMLAAGLLCSCQTTGSPKPEEQTYCPEWPELPSDVSKPKIIKSEPCVRHGMSGGFACFSAQIDENGNVKDVHVDRSDPLDFGLACADVLRRWRFEPARRGSTPVAVAYHLFVKVEG